MCSAMLDQESTAESKVFVTGTQRTPLPRVVGNSLVKAGSVCVRAALIKCLQLAGVLLLCLALASLTGCQDENKDGQAKPAEQTGQTAPAGKAAREAAQPVQAQADPASGEPATGQAQPGSVAESEPATPQAQPGTPAEDPVSVPAQPGSAAEPATQQTQQAPAAAPQAQAAPVRVYALSEPQPAASPEEQARAQAVIDYVNRAGQELSGKCAQYPSLIMLGVAEYRQNYTTLDFGLEAPAAHCAARSLAPTKGLLDDAAFAKVLSAMDGHREDMRKDYEQLRAYVADTSIVDDGRQGQKLVRQIEAAYRRYCAALEDLCSLLDASAATAQDLLLRDHPLRDHVRLAGEIVALFRREADMVARGEPDPASLEGPMAALQENITTAERLPFPLPGAAEMHYRQFLKGARTMLAILRRGQLESFHADVRAALNDEWSACKRRYNAFVEALATR